MRCEHCGSDHTIKIGKIKHKQRYRCKVCGRSMTENKYTGCPQELKDKAIKLHLEGMGFRAIGRVLNVSNVAVLKWVRKAANALPETKPPEYVEVLEMDEMWHFVKKSPKSCGSGLHMTEQGSVS